MIELETTAPSLETERPIPGTSGGKLRPPLELLVFVVGAATLGVEIAAARLMAPFFGASTIVWANTIAIVLVALSVGYWLGGRLADRHPHMRGLCMVVVAAAVILGLVPVVARPFLSLSVKAFDQLSVGAFAGSLFGVLALVSVPVLMLGAVSPWAIRLKMHDVEDSGQVAGRMYAISTVGSLVGTFAAALVLIPLVGTQRTFLTFAALLAGVAVFGLRIRWIVAPIALVALIAVPVGTVKASEDGRVIYEKDTLYQYARVVEDSTGERRLELNEGQVVHSVYRPDTVLTGNYWDDVLVAPFAVRRDAPRSMAILGNGAGTVARAYGKYFPNTDIDAVEIDSELTTIGERLFGLKPGPHLKIFSEDARPFLRRIDRKYDAIFVDAYRQPYIPFYLSTREFFSLVSKRLTSNGVLIINIGHPEDSDELEKVLTATVGSVFSHVARIPVKSVTTLLVASPRQASASNLKSVIPRLPSDLSAIAQDAAGLVAPGLKGGQIYTDDKAPVEWLIDKSIIHYAADESR